MNEDILVLAEAVAASVEAQRQATVALTEAVRQMSEAIRALPAPVVTVEAAAPVVVPAPVVENVIPQTAPAVVNVSVPDRQVIDIASLPAMNAKVKRDPQGRISGVTEG